MKIPKEASPDNNTTLEFWRAAAQKLSLETGIYIQVIGDYDQRTYTYDLSGNTSINFWLTRIYFKVEEHEFENLHDLRKGLKNKAFL